MQVSAFMLNHGSNTMIFINCISHSFLKFNSGDLQCSAFNLELWSHPVGRAWCISLELHAYHISYIRKTTPIFCRFYSVQIKNFDLGKFGMFLVMNNKPLYTSHSCETITLGVKIHVRIFIWREAKAISAKMNKGYIRSIRRWYI